MLTRSIAARFLATVVLAALPACVQQDIETPMDVDPNAEQQGPAFVDLATCGMEHSCDVERLHRGSSYPPEARVCQQAVVGSGAPGVFARSYEPGPNFYQSQTHNFFLGDGQVIRQGRFRACLDWSDDCPGTALPWDVDEAEICQVVLESDAADCLDGDGMDCVWQLTDCQPMGDVSCSALEAAIQ